MIPHNKPTISNEEQRAASKVLASGWISYGKKSREVEEKLAHMLGGGRAILVSSGTAALYLGLRALKLQEGSKVIIPTYTCTAVLNAVYMAGLEPLICDIGEDLNITPEDIATRIDSKTKAAIITHTFGFPAKIKRFRDLGVPIIEDCATAIGSFYNGKPIGSFGDLSIFSFYATKLITGGHGGAVFTRDDDIFESLSDYVNFDMPEIYKPRFNFQISDINAAVVHIQLGKLKNFIERRKSIAAVYKEYLSDSYDYVNGGAEPNYYRYLLDLKNDEKSREFIRYMEANGIMVIRPFEPSELLHNYLKLNQRFINAENYCSRLVSLPIFPSLTDDEVKFIVGKITDFER